MTKSPIVVYALCGASASGKDTLKNIIASQYKIKDMVPCTTRPKRPGEIDNKDYYFIDKDSFQREIDADCYIEWSNFRGWYYGIRTNQIWRDCIGVFNYNGVLKLWEEGDKIDLRIIYLKTPVFERLKRSYRRDAKFKIEHLRRAASDFFMIKKMERLLKQIPIGRVCYVPCRDINSQICYIDKYFSMSEEH